MIFPDENLPHAVLVDAIVKISAGMDELMNSPLNMKGVTALLVAMPNMKHISKKLVYDVLMNIKDLEKFYIKQYDHKTQGGKKIAQEGGVAPEVNKG